MNLERDYIEYVAESSLALLAVSGFYIFDPSSPSTYALLLLVPVMFGYTAYISREGFSKASLLGFVSLIFIPLGLLTGLFALFISFSNILVSYFSGGEGFNSYSSSTYMPMLLSGLLIGLLVYGAAESRPGLKQDISGEIAGKMGNVSEKVVRDSGLISQQREAARGAMRRVSESTVKLTERHVLQNSELDRQARLEVSDAFESAKKEIPERYERNANSSVGQIKISRRVQKAGTNLISSNFYMIVVISTMLFYTLNPLVSILTGVSGRVFQKLGER
ncbi:MAG: hypothetical protein ABEJ56_04735 [Candidatus Nanohaloarchaea archaeon]